MEKIIIRRLIQSDLDPMFELFTRVLGESFPEYSPSIKSAITTGKKYWNKENYAKRLVNPDRFIIGAFQNNKLVGLLDVEMPFAGVSFASWILVDQDYRGQNVGKKMVEHWENDMKENGTHFLYLYSDDRNIDFYKKMGFKVSGRFEKGWFGEVDNIMTKLIQEPKEENFLK